MKYERKKKYNTNNLGLTDLGNYDNVTFSTFRFDNYECKNEDGYKKIYIKFKKKTVLSKMMSHCYGVDILKSLILLYYKINNMPKDKYEKNITNVIIDWCKNNVYPYQLENLNNAESDQSFEMEYERGYTDFNRSIYSFYQWCFIDDLRRIGISYDYYVNLKKYFETKDTQYITKLLNSGNIGYKFKKDEVRLYKLWMLFDDKDSIEEIDNSFKHLKFEYILDNILASCKPINLMLKQTFKGQVKYKPKVESIFDLAWYAFGKILTNESPNADTKDNKYIDDERIRICESCHLPFSAKGRAKYCKKPECQSARNRKNRNNSYERTKKHKNAVVKKTKK